MIYSELKGHWNSSLLTSRRKWKAELKRHYARAGQATVTVVDDGVVIAHAEPQSRCVVYASNGQPVVSTVIEGDSQKIRLQKGQVYILTINGRTLKFAL